ncbi:MAG: hypothetical protein R3B70_00195 [Polyangiaceae bacterium]
MNRLEVREARSKYVAEPHKVLAIDGTPIDELLDAAYPDGNILGLAPAMLDWLSDPDERHLVRERILPPVGNSAIAPLLVCPDDLDLSCTVIVAEVVREVSVVSWRRIGLDATEANFGNMLPAIGGTVHWIDRIGPFSFEIAEYERCFAAFFPHSTRTTGMGAS